MPSYYKYRPLYQWGPTGRVPHPFTASIFSAASIFYSAPNAFNDPFDCALKLHANDSTDVEWAQYCDSLIAENPGRRAQLEVIKNNQMWRHEPSLYQTVGDESLDTNYNRSSVLCLAKTGLSIPMFSYYADAHSGIAIEFTFNDNEVPCGIPFSQRSASNVPYNGSIIFQDVAYPEDYPELNYHRLRGTPALVENLIFTKHSHWSHEQEFRVFRRKIPASAVQFEKRLLTRVIFGSRTTPNEVAMVKSWMGSWPTDVILSKATPSNTAFRLDLVDLETIPGIATP